MEGVGGVGCTRGVVANAGVFFVDQKVRPNNKVKMAKERAVRAVVGQRMNLMDTSNRVNGARGREPVRAQAHLGSSSLAGFAGCGG